MKTLLFLDACISTHQSRTKRLCDLYIELFLKKHPDYQVETVMLRSGAMDPWTSEKLIKRDDLIAKGDFTDPMFDLPKQYKKADHIVIGTPYWDLSFASILKVYIENIMVCDLTFGTTDAGFKGLCDGDKITYITTAGGYIGDRNYGYDYIKAIAEMTGVKSTEFFSAEGLDILGNDVEKIMKDAEEKIKEAIK